MSHKLHFLTMIQSLLCSKEDELDILWLLKDLSSQEEGVELQIKSC